MDLLKEDGESPSTGVMDASMEVGADEPDEEEELDFSRVSAGLVPARAAASAAPERPRLLLRCPSQASSDGETDFSSVATVPLAPARVSPVGGQIVAGAVAAPGVAEAGADLQDQGPICSSSHALRTVGVPLIFSR